MTQATRPEWLDKLELGLDQLPEVTLNLAIGMQQQGLGQECCVQIFGSDDVNSWAANQAERFAKGVAKRGGTILAVNPPPGSGLMRRAAEAARGHDGSRAIVIEASDSHHAANDNGFAYHGFVESEAGRNRLGRDACQASVFFAGGLPTVLRLLDLMIDKRAGCLPHEHEIVLVGEWGTTLVQCLFQHAVKHGVMSAQELSWFKTVPDARQALKLVEKMPAPRPIRERLSVQAARRFVDALRADIAALEEGLRDHPVYLTVLGSGSANLPDCVRERVRRQLTEVLVDGVWEEAVAQGGFDGIMGVTAEIAKRLRRSISLRYILEGRKQAVNDHHHVLIQCLCLEARLAALMAGRHRLHLIGGVGTFEELFRLEQTDGCRILVNDDGYWNRPLELVVYLFDEGLIDEKERGTFKPVNHPLEAMV